MPLTAFILYFLRKDADSVTFCEVKVTKRILKKREFCFLVKFFLQHSMMTINTM